MNTKITINLQNTYDEGNLKFFNLMRPELWDDLIAEYSDPDNKKEIVELLTELLER